MRTVRVRADRTVTRVVTGPARSLPPRPATTWPDPATSRTSTSSIRSLTRRMSSSPASSALTHSYGCDQARREGQRGHEPHRDQDALAPEAVREASGEVVGERLREAEDDDERQDAVRAARWKSLSARGDRMLRSIPTIAPTKALTSTRREPPPRSSMPCPSTVDSPLSRPKTLSH
jgi:hypothetical protein